MGRTPKVPDARGYFGRYGGRYVPETLMAPLDELSAAYDKIASTRKFQAELREILAHYAGRPTPLYRAARLTEHLGGAEIWLKREDLLHTGAHKLNNALGQALLTKKMGKGRVIAETGAGQHGVATATAAALMGLDCTVYMGAEDCRRQRLNVFRMQLLGAEVVSVDSGSRTLKDAINEAMRDWVASVGHSHYILGSVLGPDPFPRMVRDFHRVIGEEARAQMKKQAGTYTPQMAVACVGGGSNALGLFTAFLGDKKVRMVGVEAGGTGDALGLHAARFAGPNVAGTTKKGKKDKDAADEAPGALGVLHGTRTFLLQDDEGQIAATHSVSAGLDYPAIGPEHAYLRDLGRIEYARVGDTEAIDAFHLLAQTEGILPALESSHALAYVAKVAPRMPKKQKILVNLSGRGDKDVESVLEFETARQNGDVGGEGLDDAMTIHPAAIKWANPQPNDAQPTDDEEEGR